MAHPAEFFVQSGVSYVKTQDMYRTSDGTFINGSHINYGSGLWGTIGHSSRAASVSNWKDPAGWRSPSAYYGSRIFTYCPLVSFSVVLNAWPEYRYVQTEALNPPYAFADIDHAPQLALVRSEALKRFGAKKVDFATAFAERKKTSDMFTTAVRDIAHQFHNFKGSRAARGRKRRSVQDWWLEYRYGWTPTLLDLSGTIEWLDSRDRASMDRYVIRSKVRRTSETPVTKGAWIDTYVGSVTSTPCRWRETTSLRHGVLGSYFAQVTNDGYRSLSQCGIDNPLAVAWELVPYSFVVDWFFGVGDYLNNSQVFFSGLSYKAGTETFWTSLVSEREYVSSVGTYGTSQDVECTTKRVNSNFQRVYAPNLGAAITIKDHPLTQVHLIDALALLPLPSGAVKRLVIR